LVLSNLVDNAVRYTGENGRVHIHGRRTTDTFVVEVSDTGCGIPEAALPHIHDRFFRAAPADVDGTGLGLAICHRIVAEHDGEISVKSRTGSGTVFRVVLRAENREVAEPAAALPEIRATRAGRVLVIDDEQMLCNAIERILGADHDVTTVTSVRDALSRLGAGEQFDLILCDLMMPEMTGMDLHEELQQSMPDQAAKFIFMSGGAFTDNARAFLARSCNPVIDKPFRGSGLRQVVARFLQLESSSGTDAFSISPIASGIGRGQHVSNGDIGRDLCVPQLRRSRE
jgi:CheY-like chemotaxis protein/anti-sigma regulatory factor (Ser/Thr protein kinase)